MYLRHQQGAAVIGGIAGARRAPVEDARRYPLAEVARSVLVTLEDNSNRRQ